MIDDLDDLGYLDVYFRLKSSWQALKYVQSKRCRKVKRCSVLEDAMLCCFDAQRNAVWAARAFLCNQIDL